MMVLFQLTNIQANEPGVNVFKAETLQFRVSLNTSTLQSLHMKIQPLPGIVLL